MKTKFPGHYQLSAQQIKELWDTASIVLDTNVLLDFYRVSKQTSKELLAILGNFAEQGRIFIPYQSANEYHANILSVSDPAIDKKGNVKYTIESVNLGKTIVPFVCQSSDVLKTQDYELTVSLEKKDADSKLTVTDFQWNEPESHGGGEEWETPYSYSATEDGGVELIFAGGIEVDWTIKNYDKERLEVVGPYYEDDSCSFTLTGLSAGKCSFTVSSETAGYTLTLVLSVDQDGKITVESDEAKGNKK